MKPTSQEDIFAEGNIQDPFPLYDRLRGIGPVVWCPSIDAYVVVDKEAAAELLIRKPTDFSAGNSAYGNDVLERIHRYQAERGAAPVKLLFTLDGAEHGAQKKFVTSAFRVKDIDAEWRPRAEEIVAAQFDEADRTGRFEAMADLAVPLPVKLICDVMGIEYEGRELWGEDKVQAIKKKTFESACFLGHRKGDRWDEQEHAFFEGGGALYLPMWIGSEIAAKSAIRTPGLLSKLIEEFSPEGEYGKLTPGDAFDLNNYISMMLFAGNLTTTSAIGFMFKALAENPHVYAQVRDDPSLIDRVIEETLRYDPPGNGGYRLAARDTELAGVQIKRGEQVFFSIAAVGRDPKAYDDPNTFDINRDVYDGRRPGEINQIAHLTFGRGAHMCIGRWLARMEMEVALRGAIERYSRIELPAGYEPELLDSPMFRQLESLPLTLVR